MKLPVKYFIVVFKINRAAGLMLREYVVEFEHHRVETGLPGRGDERRREQPPARALQIEFLHIRERRIPHRRGMEKPLDVGALDAVVMHFGVIGAESKQQLLVIAQERRGFLAAAVPDERDEAAGFQDAGELRARRHRLEPVERLRRRNQIHRAAGGSVRVFGGC